MGSLGIAALGLAVATVFAPGLGSRLDVVALFGNDYLVVVPLGLGAAFVVLVALATRSIRGVDQATPPDPERLPTAEAPGADVDRLVTGGLRAAPAALRRRDRLHARLREAAIRRVMRTEHCSRDAARRRLEAGTWTDDPIAAAFVASEAADRLSARAYLAALRRFELPLQRRARRTARAIERAEGAGCS